MYEDTHTSVVKPKATQPPTGILRKRRPYLVYEPDLLQVPFRVFSRRTDRQRRGRVPALRPSLPVGSKKKEEEEGGGTV